MEHDSLARDLAWLAWHWTLSLVILIGPYLAIRFGLPLVWEPPPGGQESFEYFLALVDLNYWWIAIVYVGVSALITPQYDPDKRGLFGSPFIDNPLSLEDDYHRFMWKLAMVLFPGKVVWFTLQETFYTVRERVGGEGFLTRLASASRQRSGPARSAGRG